MCPKIYSIVHTKQVAVVNDIHDKLRHLIILRAASGLFV